MKTIVEVSNRHIHLTEEIKNIIFGKSFKLRVKRKLSQLGEFSSFSTVTIKTKKAIIENVRVVGPLRNYTQVELSKNDSIYLGLNPPVRNSGDLKNTPGITIIGSKGEVFVKNCVIIANRHLHMNEEDSNKNDYKNNEIVKAIINEKEMDNIHIKVNKNYTRALHITKDDVEEYKVFNKTYAEISKNNNFSNILFVFIEFFFIFIFIDFLYVTLLNSNPIMSIKSDQFGNTIYNAFGYRVFDCVEGRYIKSYYSDFHCKYSKINFKIEDRTKDYCAEILFYIYEDTKYKYALSCMKDIYIDFDNDTTIKIDEALNNNKVSINELESKGLKIIKEIK